MGINGRLKQISPYLLETFKEDPIFVWLFLDSKYMIDLDYVQYIQDLPADCAYNFRDEISQLQAIEKDRTKNYQKIKTDILIESENTELDLHKYWNALHFILTWNVPEFDLPFLISKNSSTDNLPLVNAVCGGTKLQYQTSYGAVRYLSRNEVKQIAAALLQISEQSFITRLNRAATTKEAESIIDWKEENVSYLLNYYKKISNFYKNAVEHKNAILLYLT